MVEVIRFILKRKDEKIYPQKTTNQEEKDTSAMQESFWRQQLRNPEDPIICLYVSLGPRECVLVYVN